MAVVKLNKLQLLGYIEDREKILGLLQSLGVVQLEEVIEKTTQEKKIKEEKSEADKSDKVKLQPIPLPNLKNLERKLDEVALAINLTSEFMPKESALQKLKKEPQMLSDKEVDKIYQDFELDKTLEIAKGLDKELKRINAQRITLKTRLVFLKPWLNLNFPMDWIGRTKNTHILIGTVPCTRVCSLMDEVRKKTELVSSDVISETEKETHFLVIVHKDLEEEVRKIAEAHQFVPAFLPRNNRTPKEEYEQVEVELNQLDEREKSIILHIKDLEKHLGNLQIIYDYIYNIILQHQANQYLGATKKTFYIEGWVRANSTEKVKSKIIKISPDADISFREPLKDEDVPVLLENKGFFKPFQVVTSIYGSPRYDEFDPTPIFAPFFFISFGFCLTDAGYGVIVAGCCALALIMFKLKEGVKQFLWLLLLGGISTIILGAVTGGWFGALFDQLSEQYGGVFQYFKKAKDSVMIFDPLKKIMLFLGLALSVGIFQLIYGVCVKFVHRVKHKRIMDAIYDQGGWLMFVFGIIVVTLKLPLSKNNPALANMAMKIGTIMVIIGVATIVLFAGRDSKNFILRIASGLWAMYGIATGLMGDFLSYSRLFALGLATGILATVIDMLSLMLIKIPYVGWIPALLLFFFGHTVNILINVLGAFVHTTRLQFVEFFPKFFEGGGRPFKAFEKKSKYIEFANEKV